MKLYFLELILTTKCNQKCSYCNVYNFNKEKTKLEIDIDFLKYILELIPQNSMIEFCGGEPGLLTNLDEAFNLVYYNPKVKKVQIMSNGLVRLNNYDWLEKENVIYNEHLIYEINDKNIQKFYDLDFIEKPRWKYVVVATKNTINSLLLNYQYFKDFGLFRKVFWYKIMIPKTDGIESYINDLEMFYEKLDVEKHHYINSSINNIKTIKGLNKNSDSLRRLCSLNCSRPVIDFETKELVHCGAYFKDSKRYKLNREIFLKHLKCELFNYENYCRKCYIILGKGIQPLISCKKGNYYNDEIYFE